MSLATAYGRVNSQMMISSLKLNSADLSEALEEVEKLSQYDFVFNYNDVKGYEVTVDLEDISLEKCLDEVLCGHPFQYKTEDDLVIVSYKEPTLRPVVQQKKISIKGKVTDEEGVGLPGVSVVVKGTHVGVATNIDGEYNIKVDNRNVTLVFSFVGMETQEYKLKKSNVLDVKLSADQGQLGEVVITGYQNLDGRKKTASIASVDMSEIRKRVEPSVDQLLQGQVAGMTIMNSSGAPGAVPQVKIRGTSTISGNTQPLWVVDGIILDDPINVDVSDILGNRNLIASGIGGINVSDIASINVLKDASATALYGTRAANGVIVITSKSGKAGKTQIKYSGSTTLSMRPRIEDAYMMNSQQRMEVNQEMTDAGYSYINSNDKGEYGDASDFEKYVIDLQDKTITNEEFALKMKTLETANTDWFKHLFRNSITQSHSLSISGGNKRTTFYVSGSYRDQQATAKGVGLKSYTGKIKVRTRVRKNIRLNAQLDITSRDNTSFFSANSRENPYEAAVNTTRTQRLYDENGDYNYMYINDLKFNYLENRAASWRNSNSFMLKGQVSTEWEMFKDFRWTSTFSFSKESTTEEDVAKENSIYVRTSKKNFLNPEFEPLWIDGGFFQGKNTNRHSKTVRNQISYNPVIDDDHEINVMLGTEINTNDYLGNTNSIHGYTHERGQQMTPQWDFIKDMGRPYWYKSSSKSASISYYGVFGYTYKEKYTLNFNARRDGSNKFGVKSNDIFKPLWSAGFNYQMKKEYFLEDVDWLSYLTLRGSYGVQGNVSSSAYSKIITSISPYNRLKEQTQLRINAPKNQNLKWEQNYSSNLALEFGLFDRRIRGTFEYYYKRGEDLLGNKQVSQIIGFSNMTVNWASMENRGLEGSLYVKLIDKKDFDWSINVNAGWNKNKVLDVYSNPDYANITNASRGSYGNSAVIGKPISGLYSFRFAGLNEEGNPTFYTGKFDDEGNELTALKSIVDTDALKYEGPMAPTIQGGFNTTVSYKNLSLSCLLIGSFGNVVRMRELQGSSLNGFTFPNPERNLPREWVNRWRKPGDENFTNIPKFQHLRTNEHLNGHPSNTYMYNNSDLRTVKGDFVRLQSLSLSYNLFTDRLREMGIQNIQFSLIGNNLHVWKNSKLKGQDPEANMGLSNYGRPERGKITFGNTYLPVPRTYSFSVNVSF
ncbi:SusC/RagA family TonB-linked outer membrane protein [Marinifilum sp. D714]|uniref:SusC/RagA family TonB-linked outer membrane protein n=1 Tax=Marinifilum sp. D714 TaxID=2937523 RepID=UPI0027CC55A9|nr:SusC/RagA family TonB-linked outer membrane protein [Marinifilum sp. D714]MDQ2178472.1 SusC/RagA family TonB-linked outer membrane protein [Marinifilum sp. D714]